MSIPFENRQAKQMRLNPAYQQVITVVEQVMCGHCRSDVIACCLNKLDGISGGDVLEDNAQAGEALNQWRQRSVDKRFFTVENVHMVVGDLAMNEQWQVVRLHRVNHWVECFQASDACIGVGCGTGRVELDAMNMGRIGGFGNRRRAGVIS